MEEAVEYVLGDCFFAVGQVIGMRTIVDFDAVVEAQIFSRHDGGTEIAPRVVLAFRLGLPDGPMPQYAS
ncbi:hypothetical protein, partial [Methylobacterium crusticola]|uniref:hypothetical protein n=1 Tax=Methylobacterium crusticola TaxID=1697972 RepID=UPI001EE2144F